MFMPHKDVNGSCKTSYCTVTQYTLVPTAKPGTLEAGRVNLYNLKSVTQTEIIKYVLNGAYHFTR